MKNNKYTPVESFMLKLCLLLDTQKITVTQMYQHVVDHAIAVNGKLARLQYSTMAYANMEKHQKEEADKIIASLVTPTKSIRVRVRKTPSR